MKKRTMSFGLALLMLCSLAANTAFAASPESVLESLAGDYIIISNTDDGTTYSNLQAFYSAAKQELSAVSDLELAKYVMDYTGQSYVDLSDEIILETLDFLEITSAVQIFQVKEDGTADELTLAEAAIALNSSVAPNAVWESDDGYMKITTYASKGTKGTNGTPYTLSATATWLKYPTFRFTDTFAIVYGGTFDDSYVITSTFKETGKCSECGATFNWDEKEEYGPESANSDPHFIKNSEIIELDFAQAQAIGAKCDIKVISCVHLLAGTPVNYAETTKMETYIRFRILTSAATEARAAYAHTKLSGKINISGSVSATGVSPSFSGTLSIIYSKYSAAPVTLLPN